MYGYIYLTTNLINGNMYIGQKKWNEYPTIDKNYLGSGTRLRHSIKTYGKENFSCRILEWCTSKWLLDAREKAWILMYDAVNNENFYNIAKGGHPEQNFTKTYRNDEWKKKQSIITKKAMDNVTLRKHLSDKNKERWNNPEYREKWHNIMLERWKSEEYREKYKNSMKKHWNNNEWKQNLSKNQKENFNKHPEYREKLSKISKKAWENPEYLEHHRQITTNLWKDPEYRKKNKTCTKLLDNQYKEIVILKVQGYTNQEIGKKFNIAPSLVSIICTGKHKSELTVQERKLLKPKEPKIKESEYQNIYNLKQNGMMQKDIAKRYNVSPSVITKILKKFNEVINNVIF